MEPEHRWQRYDWPIDMANEGDSRARVLHLVGDAHDVLELGSSSGRMTQVMHSMGKSVTAVEIDPAAAAAATPFAVRMVIADLDQPGALAGLPPEGFDLVLAADVLEHLKEPEQCLAATVPLVRPGGRVIVSVPNIAHADVRLALLAGTFAYNEIGLLDRTHIHFFTHRSLVELLSRVGLVPVVWHRTVRAVGDSEVPVEPSLVDWGRRVLDADPEATTYQWIVECVPAASAVDTPAAASIDAAPAVAHRVGEITIPEPAPGPPPTTLQAWRGRTRATAARIVRRLRRAARR